MKIPKQLKNPDFRFVLLGKWDKWKNTKTSEETEFNGEFYEQLSKEKEWKPLGKAPYERGWQNKGYKYDDPKLKNHKHNVGIIGGKGGLVIIDKDDKRLNIDLDTFCVETGTGGKHYYITSDYTDNHVFVDGLGEVRANNYQVVIPESTHPNGNKYKISKNKPIKHIPKEELKNIIKPFLRQETTLTTPTNIGVTDTSRSGKEFGAIVNLIKRGFSKEKIWQEMMYYSKWKESPEQYRELTYKKAINTIEQVDDYEDEELEYYWDKDLMNLKTTEQKWLIENQIPEQEIGFLVGKRGERKTFTALHMILCLAAGVDCVKDRVISSKTKTIFVTEEDSIESIKSRVDKMKKGMGLENTELPIMYFSFNGLKLDKRNARFEKFVDIIERERPDLIIIDSLQRCISFEVDKENQKISNFFTQIIRPMQKRYGCGWLFIHHLRKGIAGGKPTEDLLDEVRGGSELVNYARYVLMCQAPRYQTQNEEGGDMIIFRALKMSNAQLKEPRVISFTNSEDTIKVAYEGLPEEVLASEIQCAKAIKEWLINNNKVEEFRTKEIKDIKEEIGFGKTIIDAGLKCLLKQGFLKKIKKGVWQIIASDKKTLEDFQ